MMADITTDPFNPEPAKDEGPPDPFKWDDDRKAKWQGRISRAEAKQKDYHVWWDKALKVYAPSVKEAPDDWALKVRAGRAFRNVERKISELFYQRPDVSVTPSPLLEQAGPPGQVMTAAHAVIVNEKLGTEGVNAMAVVRRAVFHYELFAAGWVKIGYRAWTKPMPQAVPQLGPDGQAVMQPDPAGTGQLVPVTTIDVVDVPIKTECFMENFSVKEALIPDDFDSTDFDKAPWLGRKFRVPLSEAKRLWKKIPKDWKPGAKKQDAETKFDHGTSSSEPSLDEVSGTEIVYRSSLYRDDIIHPDHLTELVLIDGLDEPAEHRDLPHQEFDKQGRLTPDSLIGFPYHPLVIRDLPDSSYVMSDVAVGMPLTNQIDTYRAQGVEQRDINLTRFYYPTDKLPEEELSKALAAPHGGGVGVSSEAFDLPQLFKPFPHFPVPPDDHVMASILDNDYSQMLGVDPNTAGVQSQKSQTATETNVVQAHANVRQGSEQAIVANWYIRLVTKFSTLVQKYLSVDDAAQIVGMEQAQAWDAWRKALPTRLAFTIEPDSSLKNDTPLDRKQLQDVFTYLAQDPNVNRRYWVEKLCYKNHVDPTKALIPVDKIQPPKPEPPKASVSFKMEDFSPLNPWSPIAADLWTKLTNIPIDPVAVKTAAGIGQQVQEMQAAMAAEDQSQQKHGGKVKQLDSLDKHATDQTGGMQGSGVPSPGLSGGQSGVM